MLPGATVIAEVVDDTDEDPLVAPKNPYASINDFWWPENMFTGKKIKLSELRKRYEGGL